MFRTKGNSVNSDKLCIFNLTETVDYMIIFATATFFCVTRERTEYVLINFKDEQGRIK